MRGKATVQSDARPVGPVTVQADHTQVIGRANSDGSQRDELWVGGGSLAALRLYRAYHPTARIHPITYGGRSMWATGKQYDIWCDIQASWRRNRRVTLEGIASRVGCSKSTVSRFLHRLDLWRFIDLATIRGRNGGTYVFTRRSKYLDAEMWRAGAKVTRESRKVAQSILAKLVKDWEAQKAAAKALKSSILGGITGATFKGKQRVIWGDSL